jgi:hypothetical protein
VVYTLLHADWGESAPAPGGPAHAEVHRDAPPAPAGTAAPRGPREVAPAAPPGGRR